ncbi:MAG: carbonic anhydrase [bacterium]|nr:carbonic anhydrase [bacterium]
MSTTDELLNANKKYAESYDLEFKEHNPARKIAILTCMDYRINVEEMLGLKTGDAQIMRNAGATVTMDAIRSFLVAHYKLKCKEFMIIGHTDCGMTSFKSEEFKKELEGETGVLPTRPTHFHTFDDVAKNIIEGIQQVKSHPWIPDIPVRGFIYDVHSGKLVEVTDG